MKTPLGKIFLPFIFLTLAVNLLAGQSAKPGMRTGPEIVVGDHGVSRPVMEMSERQPAGPKEAEQRRMVHPNGQAVVSDHDGAMQKTAIAASTTVTSGLNFEGLGNGFAGFSVNSAPPDINGAVGATQVVEWVNESFAVFNKTTGALVKGPAWPATSYFRRWAQPILVRSTTMATFWPNTTS